MNPKLETQSSQLNTFRSSLKTAFSICLLPFAFFSFTSLAPAQTTVTLAQQYYGLGWLLCVAYSPDGEYILTGGGGGAFLWEIRTAKVVRMFTGHGRGVTSVAFSPDGTKVLTGSEDNTAKLWDASNGSLLRTFSGHSSVIYSVAFSPDGTKVLTGSEDNTAKLWDTSTGSVLRSFTGHTGNVSSVAFSPDGTKVLTGSEDNTAKLWDASNGSVLRTFSGHTASVNSVAFSPDGTKVLTGSGDFIGEDNTARLWDASAGSLLCTFSGHAASVNSVAFSPDGTKVLTGSGDFLHADNTAKLWDASNGSLLRTFSGHTNFVLSVAFSPDGTEILTGSADNMAKLWDASNGSLLRTFSGHGYGVSSVAFSPDGTKVLMGTGGFPGADETASLWDASNGSLLCTFSGHANYVESVAFSPDGTKVLTGSDDWTAKLWDASNGSLLRTFSGHTASVNSVAFSRDGTKVLTGSGNFFGTDNTAKLWDTSNGSLLRAFSGHAYYVSSVAFSPDGTKVLTGSWDGTAKLWDAPNGSEIRTFTGHTDMVYSVAFSPDGTKLVTGSRDRTAKLWDAQTGSLLRTFSGHTNWVSSVAFSPDGTKVLTGSADMKAKLWDASNGTVLRTISGHTASVTSVAFSPDGAKVLTGSDDGTARLWEIWKAKAVIVAGGGPFYGNAIAEQTKELAAYCYKICRRRGYAPNEIQYLGAFGAQDADGDGNDDVDTSATVANLHDALDRFTSDTARLFIYLVDHGYRVGDGMWFQMNPMQLLSASDLDAWLDARQTHPTYPPCHVTLIVDSCYSGNFLSACVRPPGKRRLVIASTTSDTVAVFLPPPALTSFSYQFLGALYMGYKVQQAFASARQFFNTLGVANQSPWIDSDGDGIYTPGVDDSTTGPAAEEFFGTSWAYAAGGGWEPPAFEAVTPNQSPMLGTTVTIWVRMLPYQVPQRVWATILPPAAEPLAGQALTDLPRVELVHTTDTRWESPFTSLTVVGTYVVAHVAQFEGARITQPVYSTLNVGTLPTIPIKALLVSGRDTSGTISSQTIALANLAYRVSRHRGHTPSRIRYLSAFGNQDADGDRMNDVFSSANLANLTTALSTWASSDCARLLVYLVGPGERVGGQAVFRLSPTEALTSGTLDALLDTLQTNAGTTDVIVVADFPYAADFLRSCQPPSGKRRVLIAGTDTPNAVFLEPPQCTSFSFLFLSAAHMGYSLKDSFSAARHFFRVWTGFNQRPWLDDDGDGDSDKWDGTVARSLHWGYPWAFAGPEAGELPFVLDAGTSGSSAPGTLVTLWARLMEGPVPERVFATIIPPTVAYGPGQPVTGFPQVDLQREGASWRWSATTQCLTQGGTYTFLFHALYGGNRLSTPRLAYLRLQGEPYPPDAYEDDDLATSATDYVFSGVPEFPSAQLHNFHDTSDTDWVKFYGYGGWAYSLNIENPAPRCDAVIELYDSTTATVPLDWVDDAGAGGEELLSFIAPATGTYYWKVYNYNGSVYGEETTYTLRLTKDTGANNGLAIALNSTALRCSWWPSGLQSGDVGYNLYRVAPLENMEWIKLTSAPIVAMSYDETGLKPDTWHVFHVTIQSAGGAERSFWPEIFDGTTSSVVWFDSPVSLIAEGAGTAQLVLHLSMPKPDPVIVRYSVGGTATPGGDYAILPGSVTFAPNETITIILAPIIGDVLDESDETVIVTLTGATVVDIGTTSVHTLTILDDDPPPTVSFLARDSSVSEGAGTAILVLALSAISGTTVTVNYSRSGTATGSGVDYSIQLPPVTFTPGETTKPITAAITDDALDEPDETVVVTLTDATNATLAGITSHTLTIQDNDPTSTLGFERATQRVDEDGGSVPATVCLVPASGKTVSMHYRTVNGTATAGSDYTSASGTLTFNPGETSKTIHVSILNDSVFEGTETLSIRLSGAVNATVTTGTQVIAINDDDGKPLVRFATSSSSADEGVGRAYISVNLSRPSASGASVGFNITGGTATRGQDYSLTTGTLRFGRNVTATSITVTVINDTLDEYDETILLSLLNPTTATLGATTIHTFTIRDNDATPTVRFAQATGGVPKNIGLARIPVQLSAASGKTVRVNFSTANVTAIAGTDYLTTSGQPAFIPGQTTATANVRILPNRDRTPKTLRLNLASPQNASLGTNPFTLTIEGDTALQRWPLYE